MKTSGEYRKQLKEAKLDKATISSKNSARFLKALKALEVAGKDESCAFCGKRTYKDACVIIRPGFWAAPRSFHERDCLLNKVMNEALSEIIKEEEEQEKIWRRTEGVLIARRVMESTRKVLDSLKAKRNE